MTGLPHYRRITVHSSIPVSYTHLDVYKRQVIDTSEETELTIPVEVTAGSLRADGFIPTEVINICKVSDCLLYTSRCV